MITGHGHNLSLDKYEEIICKLNNNEFVEENADYAAFKYFTRVEAKDYLVFALSYSNEETKQALEKVGYFLSGLNFVLSFVWGAEYFDIILSGISDEHTIMSFYYSNKDINAEVITALSDGNYNLCLCDRSPMQSNSKDGKKAVTPWNNPEYINKYYRYEYTVTLDSGILPNNMGIHSPTVYVNNVRCIVTPFNRIAKKIDIKYDNGTWNVTERKSEK